VIQKKLWHNTKVLFSTTWLSLKTAEYIKPTHWSFQVISKNSQPHCFPHKSKSGFVSPPTHVDLNSGLQIFRLSSTKILE